MWIKRWEEGFKGDLGPPVVWLQGHNITGFWSVSEVFLKCFWSVYEVFLKCVWSVSEVCMKCVWTSSLTDNWPALSNSLLAKTFPGHYICWYNPSMLNQRGPMIWPNIKFLLFNYLMWIMNYLSISLKM